MSAPQAKTDGPNTHKYRDADHITSWTLIPVDDVDGVRHLFHVPTVVADVIRADHLAYLRTNAPKVVDSLRAPDTDIEPPPYEADPFPVSWDFLAIVVITAACIAFGWWAFLR